MAMTGLVLQPMARQPVWVDQPATALASHEGDTDDIDSNRIGRLWPVGAGELVQQFPLSVWQTGSGTPSNMNVNEVVARLASDALGGDATAACRVHPNDDVNLGQSSNDVFPTAMHIAAVRAAGPLLDALAQLRGAIQAKATEFAAVVKIGRARLQDATPVTLGQEFGGYDAQLGLAEAALRQAADRALASASCGCPPTNRAVRSCRASSIRRRWRR